MPQGLRTPPDDQADLTRSSTTTTTATVQGVTQDETVHTTANHPWLEYIMGGGEAGATIEDGGLGAGAL